MCLALLIYFQFANVSNDTAWVASAGLDGYSLKVSWRAALYTGSHCHQAKLTYKWTGLHSNSNPIGDLLLLFWAKLGQPNYHSKQS